MTRPANGVGRAPSEVRAHPAPYHADQTGPNRQTGPNPVEAQASGCSRAGFALHKGTSARHCARQQKAREEPSRDEDCHHQGPAMKIAIIRGPAMKIAIIEARR
jgi:hypothetical protein